MFSSVGIGVFVVAALVFFWVAALGFVGLPRARCYDTMGALGSAIMRTWLLAHGDGHMEKDREEAVDAITTQFSSMLDNVDALTSRSSQIAGLGLCRAGIDGWRVVLPSASRAL